LFGPGGAALEIIELAALVGGDKVADQAGWGWARDLIVRDVDGGHALPSFASQHIRDEAARRTVAPL
jgi:hypothetical protein